MMMKTRLALTAAVIAWVWSGGAVAEPYLAVQEGYKCSTCHVSASGGGMRNVFGNVYAQMLLPAHTVGEDTESFKWNGEFLKYLKAGANVRGSEKRTSIRGRSHGASDVAGRDRLHRRHGLSRGPAKSHGDIARRKLENSERP